MKRLYTLSLVLILIPIYLVAQEETDKKNVTIKFEPDPVVLQVGTTISLELKAFDDDGNELEGGHYIFQPFDSPTVLRETGLVASSGAAVDTLGNITGLTPGIYSTYLFRAGSEDQKFAVKQYFITVTNAPVAEISIKNIPEKLYAGTTIALDIEVLDEEGFSMDPSMVDVQSKDQKVASVDGLGNLRLHSRGKTTLITKSGSIENSTNLQVYVNPATSVQLSVNTVDAVTGDVLHFECTAFDKNGQSLNDVPIFFAVSGSHSEMATSAGAIINQQGAFVAEKPGIYTVIASSGNATDLISVKILPRDVQREIEFAGQGAINKTHTSDFWIWEGVDGRDYAVTGTHSANGTAFFWDVTNPSNIIQIDSIQVDARTVNDVKVSEDGRICIISREGASNRKNGIVILDVSDPSNVKELATYTENLTGGVHNLFIYKDHVYALSNGQKYEIINISDPANPYRVSKFEIDNPARSIHDIWIEDGIAYSSNWNDGVILVDVGNGIAGGSPENPVEILRAKSEGDANHAAFPFRSKSTGKRYVIMGDEIFPVNVMTGGLDQIIIPKGYIHFIDITDTKNPVEVARYEVPEAGSHNLWVDDDVLYIGYYNGGLRVVDISGELMGDIYKQGREIGHFLPYDKNGYIPNNTMTWGAQPHKGHIFFSDFNSGLWAAKIKPIEPDEATIEVK